MPESDRIIYTLVDDLELTAYIEAFMSTEGAFMDVVPNWDLIREAAAQAYAESQRKKLPGIAMESCRQKAMEAMRLGGHVVHLVFHSKSNESSTSPVVTPVQVEQQFFETLLELLQAEPAGV